MHDNACYHAARLTTEYLNSVFTRHGKIKASLLSRFKSYRNCSILKRIISPVEGSTDPRIDLWDVILTATKDISLD